jgi:hypothetical protein
MCWGMAARNPFEWQMAAFSRKVGPCRHGHHPKPEPDKKKPSRFRPGFIFHSIKAIQVGR